jgi:hypothetical protein
LKSVVAISVKVWNISKRFDFAVMIKKKAVQEIAQGGVMRMILCACGKSPAVSHGRVNKVGRASCIGFPHFLFLTQLRQSFGRVA